MTDIHESEVTVVKIQHINEDNVITILTAEAKGKVFITEISYGGFFTGIQHNKKLLFGERLIGTTTIAIHKSIERFENGHWAEKKLVAFGATNEVVVCSLKPIGVVLKI